MATVQVVRSPDRDRSPGLTTMSESRHTWEAARHHMFLPHTHTDSTTKNTTFFFSHIHSGHQDPACHRGTLTFKPSVFPTLFSL